MYDICGNNGKGGDDLNADDNNITIYPAQDFADETEEDIEAYMIDVAKSSSYQNQTEEYYREFVKWRSKADNPYGYKFVKDSREHTYEDGKGFVDDGPSKAEKEALLNCCRLMGIVLLSLTFVTVIQMMVMPLFGGNSYVSDLFMSGFSVGEDKQRELVIASSIFSVLRLLVPAVIFKCVSRIPMKVILPKAEKRDLNLSVTGITFMLMAVIIGNYTNRYLAKLFALVNIDFSSFNMINTRDPVAIIVYSVCEYVIVSILIEIFYRGMILQTFRQFGDLFALILSGVINVLSFGDITMTGYIFMSSLVVGLFTLRSGSIYTAIAMRITARAAIFFTSVGITYVDPKISSLVETFISLTVISAALIAYSRLLSNGQRNFNLADTMTHINGKTKLITLLSSKAMTVWFVSAVIIIILNIRFL